MPVSLFFMRLIIRCQSRSLSTISAALLISAGTILPLPAHASEYLIAVPEILPTEYVDRLHRDVMDLTLRRAGPGDRIRIVNGVNASLIASFDIPTGSVARIENLRRQALSKGLSAWKAFAVRNYVNPDKPNAPADNIQLPQLLDAIGSTLYADQPLGERKICSLIIGNAQYADPREPEFSMIEGRFPADGLIAAPRIASPYGTADRQKQLEGIYINLAATDSTWPDELYRLRVERVWSLFIGAQSGKLITFTDDYAAAYERFLACQTEPAQTFEWDTTRNSRAMISADRTAEVKNVEKLPEPPQPPEPMPEKTVNRTPDKEGRFGRVMRITAARFPEQSGVIRFDEVPLQTGNPIYTPSLYSGDAEGTAVSFGGYFDGQRTGRIFECPAGANPGGCVIGNPDAPIRLNEAAPPTRTVDDGSNPDSPSLSGTPIFNGPVSILFERDMAAVGLNGGYFNQQGSTAIQAYDRQGNLIGGVTNLSEGMEFLGLMTDDGKNRIAAVQFSLIGAERSGYGIDFLHFATAHQFSAKGN